MNYKKLRTYSKKEVEEIIKRAFAIESPISIDIEDLRIRFRMDLAEIPIKIKKIEVLCQE